jgi:amino acid transporter
MDEREIKLEETKEEKTRYGMWAGVVVPCIQNMIGITLFVRMPWIVGEAGIGMTLAILGVCLSTSLITTLSMNAVVTNGKLSTGGCYYVLARSLGASIGGSVGTLYFFGQATSSSLYLIGTVEIFIDSTGDEIVSKEADIRILGIVLCVILWLINVGFQKHIKKITIFCIFMLILALLTVYIGLFTAGARGGLPNDIKGLDSHHFSSNFDPEYSSNVRFHELITIFYPAVIGFFAGTSKSKELRNPNTGVPKGTMIAILIASSVYLSVILLVGGVTLRPELKENFAILFTVAWPTPFLTTACVLIVSSGAALQCMAGASEVLFSIANDDILPLGWIKSELRALHLTTFLVSCLVLIGSLDDVAPVITMFFLLFDASINFACALLSLLNNPSWRPTWPYFHWTIAICGSILCIVIMLYISWWAALIAYMLAIALYL